MKKLLCITLLFAALAAVRLDGQSPPSGWVVFTGSALRNGGSLIPSGVINLSPVNQYGQPVGFRIGGQAGQNGPAQLSATVTNGAVQASFYAPDTYLTWPQNLCFNVTVTTVQGVSLWGPGYSCVQPASSGQGGWCTTTSGVTTCDFDNYTPALPPQPAITPYASSINGLYGAFTLTGPGVSQSGTTFTLSGTGAGLGSIGWGLPSWLTASPSTISASGTEIFTPTTGQTPHQVIGTCGTATSFAPCALVLGDLPTSVFTLTTNASAGPASYTNGVLNIPDYVSGAVTSVTGTAPVNVSGGATPGVSLASNTLDYLGADPCAGDLTSPSPNYGVFCADNLPVGGGSIASGAYAGTYTSNWTLAKALAANFVAATGNGATLVAKQGIYNQCEDIVLPAGGGTGRVSLRGEGMGTYATRFMAWGIPNQVESPNYGGTIIRSTCSQGPMWHQAAGTGSQASVTIRDVNFDNTSGLAHGNGTQGSAGNASVLDLEGTLNAVVENVTMSDQSVGPWPTIMNGSTGSNGYSAQLSMRNIKVQRDSSNSATSQSAGARITVNVVAGQVPTYTIVAGGVVSSDAVPLFTGYSAANASQNPCPTMPSLPTFAVTGGIIGAALVSSGPGYQIGDTLVPPGGSGTGVLTVNAVDSSGHILGFAANADPGLGTGYNGGQNQTLTPVSVHGTGSVIANVNALGPVTSVTATSNLGVGCDGTTFYLQIVRPPLAVNIMEDESTSDSKYYDITLGGSASNAGFYNNNHGGTYIYGLHVTGIGGLTKCVEDDWGGLYIDGLNCDTINSIAIDDQAPQYALDSFMKAQIYENSTYGPFPGMYFMRIKSSGQVVQNTNQQCSSSGQQTAGGYTQYVDQNGPIAGYNEVGLQGLSNMPCGNAVPAIPETSLAGNVSVTNGSSFTIQGGNLEMNHGNVDMLPFAAATSSANSSSNILNLWSSQWNGSAAVNSNWELYDAASRGLTTDEVVLAYQGLGSVAGTQLTSAIGFDLVDPRSATVGQNIPAPYFCQKGRVWAGSGTGSPSQWCWEDVMSANGLTPNDTYTLVYNGGGVGSASRFFSTGAVHPIFPTLEVTGLTGYGYMNGAAPVTASTTIPYSAITGFSDQPSVSSFCTGTASSSATLAFFQLGTTTTSCTGSTNSGVGFLMPRSGTVANLVLRCSTTGVAGTSSITIGVNPANGVALTINGTTVTFVTSGATGNQVNIGGSATLTATALYTFLIGSGDSNLVKSTYTNPSAGVVLLTPVVLSFPQTLATSTGADFTFIGQSGVATIYDLSNAGGGTATATPITVAYGTTPATTAVSDAAHTYAASAGDLLQVRLTTQASETLAGCSVSFTY